MAVSWLKTATLNVSKPKFSVIDTLKKSVGGYQPPRPMSTVHASDITKADFCPRHWALLELLDKENEKKGMYVGTALQATFDLGNAIAGVVINKWLRDYAVGHWKCRRCHTFRTFQKYPGQNSCLKGMQCDWVYEEVVFKSPVLGVSGSIDVILDLGGPKYHPIELKIMAVKEFEDLVAPLAEHRIRTNLYLKLIDEDVEHPEWTSKIDTMMGKVLYVSRGFGKKHPVYNEILPFKEYDVVRSEDGLSEIAVRATLLKDFRADKTKIPVGICATPLSKYAEKCNTCMECFSGKFPPKV